MSDWSDIGSMLRHEREVSGWSLLDVSHETRIPVQVLHELEENDYRNFPSPAYARSFLGQYSDFLEIDATECLDAFDTGAVFSNLGSYDYLKDHDEHLAEGRLTADKERIRLGKGGEGAGTPEPVSRRSTSAALQALVVLAVSVALLIGAALGFLHLNDQLSERLDEDPGRAAGQESPLKPAPSVVPSRPAPPRHPAPGLNPAPAMAGTAESPRVIRATPVEDDSTPDLLTGAPPPRAVIVEE